MATLQDRLSRARDVLVAAGIDPSEASLDASLLARHVLGWDRARLLANIKDEAPAGFDEAFTQVIERRRRREPVAHITGHREFWGLDFEVTSDALTPRPESELIVEEAIATFPDRPRLKIVDVGTGSGCLAVALAVEFPDAAVFATDVSPAALALARRNAERHRVGKRISFVQTDLLPTATDVDLIVSNPPYVPERDAPSLAPEVRDHEPHVALFGGADGLAVYRRLLPDARAHASTDGLLIVEVGYDQDADVTALAAESGWRLVRSRRDLQGIARTLVFRNEDRNGC